MNAMHAEKTRSNASGSVTITPHLVVMTPPLQGHRVPLNNLSNHNDSFHLNIGGESSFLSHLLPVNQGDIDLSLIDNQWMITTLGKGLLVNNEPVHTAIVENGDTIQYGKLFCRFHSVEASHNKTLQGQNLVRFAKRKKTIVTSAALTLSLVTLAASYLVAN